MTFNTATIRSFDQLHEGQEAPFFEAHTDTTQLVRYAGAAHDFARQHWDKRYMEELGFPDVIVHGWFTLARICQVATNWIPPEIADIKAYKARYHLPMFPGAASYGGRVTRKFEQDARMCVELELWARNTDGNTTTSAKMVLAAVTR